MYIESNVLFPSATRTTATTGTNSTEVFHGMWRRATFLLDVTATAGAAGDVFNAYIDVLAPDGNTWLNAVHFTQIAGNSAAVKHFAVLDATNVAATTFAVSTDCESGVTKPYLFGPKVRGRYSLTDAGAHGQSVTFSLSAYYIK